MRLLLILIALIPHLYVTAVGSREAGSFGFVLGVLLWNLVPVMVGARAAYSRFRHQGVAWLLATLVSSSWAVWVGLLNPRGSTGALIFLFLPAWNLILVGPAAAMLATLWERYASRRKPRTGDASAERPS